MMNSLSNKNEALLLSDAPTDSSWSPDPPAHPVSAVMESCAALHGSLQLGFIVFIGLLGPRS